MNDAKWWQYLTWTFGFALSAIQKAMLTIAAMMNSQIVEKKIYNIKQNIKDHQTRGIFTCDFIWFIGLWDIDWNVTGLQTMDEKWWHHLIWIFGA